MTQAEELVPILVVDDQASNLLTMKSLLESMGLPLQVVSAEDGNRALRLCLQQPFALILLDVQMPGMNGYEVAELLRSHPKTGTLPIIFVTAGLTNTPHVIRGYESGAVDYLPKPLDRHLLTSKVRVFTELFQQRRQLERHEEHLEAEVRRRSAELLALNTELEQRVEERSQQLQQALLRVVEAEQHAALGRLVAGIAHEMNTPIGNILLGATTLSAELARLGSLLKADKVSRQELLALGEQGHSAALMIEANASRAAALVSNFKELGSLSRPEAPAQFDLAGTLESCLLDMSSQLQAARVQLQLDIKAGSGIGFPEALRRIVTILVNNSLVHAFKHQAQPCIRLQAQLTSDQLLLGYSDNGCGVNPANLPRLFDPFFTTRLGQGGSGLGLSIVRKLAVEQMKGEVRASAPAGEGLRLDFRWPLGQAEMPV
ncbi:signal transduction histidine kinase [Paucibacter oligotrophus]|uniref:histidine kinase n=1 Tax=Roseateles oligotrophus TaxID=1769250 RepID=A0A840LFY2_9BURK|nr:response regulator [Roseateles oligotrophus]MBB4845935.1 signal transduction histidine kinase [Roseateles oligotrophus]